MIPLAVIPALRLAGSVAATAWRYRVAIVGAVVVAALLIQRNIIDRQREGIAALFESAKQSGDALRSANDVIATLQAANRELAEGRAADRAAAADAIANIEQHRDRLTADLITERRARSALYHADPIAADWSRQPVPGPVADRLRR